MVGTQPPNHQVHTAEELQHQLHFFLKGLALVARRGCFYAFKSWNFGKSMMERQGDPTVDWLLLVKGCNYKLQQNQIAVLHFPQTVFDWIFHKSFETKKTHKNNTTTELNCRG